MAVDIPREVALKILYEVNEKGAYTNIALNKHLDETSLKSTDRAFITELVYGAVKWKLAIDWAIRQFSSIRLKKISPWILNVLRLGAYQLLFTDRIPVSAACNESVNLAKKYGHKGSVGFVNALVRKIADNRDNLKYPEKKDNIIEYLSVRYSHPEWMVKKFLGLFGEEFTESLLYSNNRTPELTIRVNSLKTTREKLVEALAQENIEALPGKYSSEAVVIKNPSSITKLEAFKKGLFQVQDESSMLVGQVLGPKPGEYVMDVCSAPGGKATHIAQLMENKGTVLARDVHPHKIKLINDAAERLELGIIKTELFDATVYESGNDGKADRVLLDAPCTGWGIIRKKPDIKWSREMEAEAEIIKLQLQLIDVASKYVKPGGILVYSTCTINPGENGEVVKSFLASHEEFELDNIAQSLPAQLQQRVEEKGMLQLYPNRDDVDGFFIARLRRKQWKK